MNTGTDLTLDAAPSFRAVLGEGARPWAATLADAVAGLAPRRVATPWTRRWMAVPLPDSMDRKTFEPSKWHHSLGSRQTVTAGSTGIINLADTFGAPRAGHSALLMATLPPGSGPLRIHAGADWWMRWWADGVPVFDTLDRGNGNPVLERAHEFELPAGVREVAVLVVSGNGGWAFASEASVAVGEQIEEQTFSIEALKTFDVADPTEWISLTLNGDGKNAVRLNDHIPRSPLRGMRYREIPGLSPTLLKPRGNILQKSWGPQEAAAAARSLHLEIFRASGPGGRIEFADSLTGFHADDARFQTGPLIQLCGSNSVAIIARTNFPAAVRLDVDGQNEVSRPGVIHRFVLDDLAAGREHILRLEIPEAPAAGREGSFQLPAGECDLTLLIVGDASPQPHIWSKVAAMALDHHPDFMIFLGDATSCGLDDWRWDEEFFAPAADLFNRLPFVFIPGNHDEDTPLLRALFPVAGGRHWGIRFPLATFLGLDGTDDFAPGTSAEAWLRRQLDENQDRSIFVANHYQSWTSSNHGELSWDGLPSESPARQARMHILPLLGQGRATAYFNGHNHCYERSEPPGEPISITSGGAGGYLYERTADEGQNPHSKLFCSEHHFCILRIGKDFARLTAHSIKGELLDSIEIPPIGFSSKSHPEFATIQ